MSEQRADASEQLSANAMLSVTRPATFWDVRNCSLKAVEREVRRRIMPRA
jgi:hypothetical protein